MHISLKWLGRFARNQRQMKEKKKCLCDFDVRFLMRCLVFKIYAIKVGQFCQNMVKKWTFSENMRTRVLLTPDGETTSTLHYFCLKLHHFTSQMTPIGTHFFIPIPSKTRFCKTLSDFCAKLATFQNHSAAKGLIITKSAKTTGNLPAGPNNYPAPSFGPIGEKKWRI